MWSDILIGCCREPQDVPVDARDTRCSVAYIYDIHDTLYYITLYVPWYLIPSIHLIGYALAFDGSYYVGNI